MLKNVYIYIDLTIIHFIHNIILLWNFDGKRTVYLFSWPKLISTCYQHWKYQHYCIITLGTMKTYLCKNEQTQCSLLFYSFNFTLSLFPIFLNSKFHPYISSKEVLREGLCHKSSFKENTIKGVKKNLTSKSIRW